MKTWFTIKASASSDTASITIHDEIGYFGVSAKDFVAQMKAIPSNVLNLTVSIDSPGGDVNDGLTIFDAISAFKSRGGNVSVDIIGLAASMASVIMLAGNNIRIAENGRVMIHRVTGGVYGNADDLAAGAQLVKQMEDRIISIYQTKTGKDEVALRDMMKAELGTWFFGQEAVDNGFADEVMSGVAATAFKPQWAACFTMLPAALFKDFDKSSNIMPKNEAEKETPEVATEPVVEPSAPVEEEVIEEAPEEIVVTVEPSAPEAKGIIERTISALTGAKAKDDRIAILETEAKNHAINLAELSATNATLKAKADKADELEAALKLAEAEAKTASQQAADIAASNGFKESAGNELPAVSDIVEVKTLTRADFNQLKPKARAAFFKDGGKLTE